MDLTEKRNEKYHTSIEKTNYQYYNRKKNTQNLFHFYVILRTESLYLMHGLL